MSKTLNEQMLSEAQDSLRSTPRSTTTSWTNRLLAAGGITTLVAMLVLMVLPVSSMPLLDANRQVLVESIAEADCAGQVYVSTRGSGSESGMSECIADSDLPTEANWPRVPQAFCQSIINQGLTVTLDECLSITKDRQIWFTMKGTLTDAWNRRFPYPLSELGVPSAGQGDESRTGDRITNEREGLGRD